MNSYECQLNISNAFIFLSYFISGHLAWHVGRCSPLDLFHTLVCTITSSSNTWSMATDFQNLSFVPKRCKLSIGLFFYHILPHNVPIATHLWQDAGHWTLKIVQHLMSCSRILVQFESISGCYVYGFHVIFITTKVDDNRLQWCGQITRKYHGPCTIR